MNWAIGRRLPDYSIVKDLCTNLDISINEFFAGERIPEKEYKKKAEENLLNALENSVFTLKERIAFFKRKWQKEHFFGLILFMIVIVFFIIFGFIKDNGIQYLFMVIGLVSGVIENNRMMAYVEKNAYGKKNISIEEVRNSIDVFMEIKERIMRFKTKEEALKFLVHETNLSKKECSSAYDFIMKLDFDKFHKE